MIYELLSELQPDGYLVLGDTNSCLSAISAKRLHIPLFQTLGSDPMKKLDVQDQVIPDNVVLHGLKQRNGKFIVRIFGVMIILRRNGCLAGIWMNWKIHLE